jgi:hypothetical protein
VHINKKFPAIFVMLTSIRGRDYHSFVMGSVDPTLNGSVSRVERKSKSLYPVTLESEFKYAKLEEDLLKIAERERIT